MLTALRNQIRRHTEPQRERVAEESKQAHPAQQPTRSGEQPTRSGEEKAQHYVHSSTEGEKKKE